MGSGPFDPWEGMAVKICGRMLGSVRPDQSQRGIGDAVIREYMRLGRQAYVRGAARDFQPGRLKGRTVLPLVTR